MALLKNKHYQKDFFALDVGSLSLKDDMASMEHPIFSLSTKPDMRHLTYKNGNIKLRVIPSGEGLPTIMDKDILIYCISLIMQRKRLGEKVSKTIKLTAHELLIATNRSTNDLGYKRLEEALIRLRGTTLKTNIDTGGKRTVRVFGIIDEGGFIRAENKQERLQFVEITFSDWVMRAINSNEVLSISKNYFLLRRPLERRIYEIARKHCGIQKCWQIKLDLLLKKTGSKAPIKKFRFNLRQIIAEDNTPSYKIKLTEGDMVIFTPRKKKLSDSISVVDIPEWAIEKAREIAVKKRWDYYVLEREWLEYTSQNLTKETIKNIGATFVAFCNNKKSV